MKRLAWIAIAAAATLTAADLTAFNGTWKLNPQKSRLEGETVAFKKGAGGMIVQSAGVYESKFRIDGKDYTTSMGTTVAWKEAGPNAWETDVKSNGKHVFTVRSAISPDGKSLTTTTEGNKPSGEPFQETARYVRTAGDSGLLGTWRSEKVNTAADTMMLQASAKEFTMTYPDWKASVTATLDGKGHPFTGPTIPPGFTIGIRPVDARTVDVEGKKDGKPFQSGRMQVSADGKTLTDTETMAGQKAALVFVYDKQ